MSTTALRTLWSHGSPGCGRVTVPSQYNSVDCPAREAKTRINHFDDEGSRNTEHRVPFDALSVSAKRTFRSYAQPGWQPTSSSSTSFENSGPFTATFSFDLRRSEKNPAFGTRMSFPALSVGRGPHGLGK